MAKSTRTIGDNAEEQVAVYLAKNGFTIKARNYYKQYGEIDIVAQKKDLLIFVEVKFRTNQLAQPSFLVPRTKQRKIIMVAKQYLAQHTIDDKICRFDIALVDAHSAIQYIPNAFMSEE